MSGTVSGQDGPDDRAPRPSQDEPSRDHEPPASRSPFGGATPLGGAPLTPASSGDLFTPAPSAPVTSSPAPARAGATTQPVRSASTTAFDDGPRNGGSSDGGSFDGGSLDGGGSFDGGGDPWVVHDGGDPQVFRDETPASGGGRKVVIGGLVLGALLVLGYGGAAFATSRTVPAGTTVGGVPVGGMSAAAAEQKLAAALAAVPVQLPVTAGGRRATVDRSAAGLTFDPREAVDGLAGFSLSPRNLWRHVTDGPALPAGDGAAEATSAALTTALPALEVAARNAGVSFSTSEPKVTDAVAGQKVDVGKAVPLLRTMWLKAGAAGVSLPVVASEPDVTSAEASAAVDALATPALSQALKVTVGSRTATVAPEALAPSLRLVTAPAGTDGLVLAVDGPTLRSAVLKADPAIETKPKDARVQLSGGVPKVLPSVSGVTVDPAALATAALKVLAAGAHAVTVATKPAEPELTTAKANALGVKERISTFSTNLTSNAGRTENLRIAARTVNGTLVMPGETFSLNGVLGQRTAAKGYNAAPAISGGRLVQDYGGGVSQMATTIFNNVFFAGLEDVYHKPHSFYISRYPEGREATVDYPSVDLKWKNDSPYGVLIEANVTRTVNVSFYSTKVWDIEATKSARTNLRSPETVYDDEPGCVEQGANSGFDVTVGRIFRKNGSEVKRESFKAVYNAEDEIICSAKPAEEQTPIPPPD